MLSGKKNRGFTLFELIVTIAVAAIIVSFGVPGFISFVQNNRATTDTNDLITALNLARSEATRRGVPITVCSSSDGAGCSDDDDWSNGWIVLTAADEVLRVWPERSDDGVVSSTNVSQVTFDARGSLVGGTTPLISIELPDCTGNNERQVSVNVAGRISVDRAKCG